MFVRYVSEKGVIRTLECKTATWNPKEGDNTGTMAHVILDEGMESESRLEVECVPGNEYYLMSNNGKTIDRLIW